MKSNAIRRIAVLTLVIGVIGVLAATLASRIGLGHAEQFVTFKLIGLTRTGLFKLSLLLIAAGCMALCRIIRREAIISRLRVVGECLPVLLRARVTKPIKDFFAMRVGTLAHIVMINALTVGACLVVVELYVRNFVPEPSIYKAWQPGQFFRFQPYFVSSNEGPLNHNGIWHDPLHNVDIPFTVRANSLGFRIDRELDTTTIYEKTSDERVVLIFGGSAVYGFGNTSNETTIAGWLQKILNGPRNRIRYTVFNMGNGGWISYQQFIALNLYGMNLKPDWIIFMDGRNDIFTISALAGDDIGLPFATTMVRDLADGYLYRQPNRSFYRGEWENILLESSVAYRRLTNKLPVARHQSTPYPPTRDWSHIEKTVDFYLRTQRSVLAQCAHCSYILSTQPIYRSGRKRLDQAERAEYRRKYANLRFDNTFASKPEFEDVLMYAHSRIIDEMPDVCATQPHCRYKAMDDVFPASDSEKNSYFVDDVHMTDDGNRLVAEYYASIIRAPDASTTSEKPGRGRRLLP